MARRRSSLLSVGAGTSYVYFYISDPTNASPLIKPHNKYSLTYVTHLPSPGALPLVVDRRAEIKAERKQQREAQRKHFDRERVRTYMGDGVGLGEVGAWCPFDVRFDFHIHTYLSGSTAPW